MDRFGWILECFVIKPSSDRSVVMVPVGNNKRGWLVLWEMICDAVVNCLDECNDHNEVSCAELVKRNFCLILVSRYFTQCHWIKKEEDSKDWIIEANEVVLQILVIYLCFPAHCK